ncbi:MAG: hypothetical protein JRD49_14390 [Deltaproteobacteria bacterium]|nr:hypothetical protein [Deltaproteobacteria bacterium]MBW2678738.1 hypothetical protein [Deltaproteobacteria bacterium]
MNENACHIRDRFPDQCPVIDFLMAVDHEFLILCEDYEACVKALRYWAISSAPEAETRVNEYRTIARELQEEIAGALANLDFRRST